MSPIDIGTTDVFRAPLAPGELVTQRNTPNMSDVWFSQNTTYLAGTPVPTCLKGLISFGIEVVFFMMARTYSSCLWPSEGSLPDSEIVCYASKSFQNFSFTFLHE